MRKSAHVQWNKSTMQMEWLNFSCFWEMMNNYYLQLIQTFSARTILVLIGQSDCWFLDFYWNSMTIRKIQNSGDLLLCSSGQHFVEWAHLVTHRRFSSSSAEKNLYIYCWCCEWVVCTSYRPKATWAWDSTTNHLTICPFETGKEEIRWSSRKNNKVCKGRRSGAVVG